MFLQQLAAFVIFGAVAICASSSSSSALIEQNQKNQKLIKELENQLRWMRLTLEDRSHTARHNATQCDLYRKKLQEQKVRTQALLRRLQKAKRNHRRFLTLMDKKDKKALKDFADNQATRGRESLARWIITSKCESLEQALFEKYEADPKVIEKYIDGIEEALSAKFESDAKIGKIVREVSHHTNTKKEGKKTHKGQAKPKKKAKVLR